MPNLKKKEEQFDDDLLLTWMKKVTVIKKLLQSNHIPWNNILSLLWLWLASATYKEWMEG